MNFTKDELLVIQYAMEVLETTAEEDMQQDSEEPSFEQENYQHIINIQQKVLRGTL